MSETASFSGNINRRSFRETALAALAWPDSHIETPRLSRQSSNAGHLSLSTDQTSLGPDSNQTAASIKSEELAPVESAHVLVSPETESNVPTDQEAVSGAKADPFAGGIEGGVEYKTMVWWHAGMVMVAETISLGILSLPMALAVLGIIPGLILLISLGIMASYSGYVIGQFRTAHPHIHSWADAGEVLFGAWGRELLGAGQLLFVVFIMGSHILTFSVMMNTITDNGTCSVVFMVVGTIISLIFTLPRTLENMSYYSIASFISVIAAVLVTMIGVSITHPSRHFNILSNQWVQDIRLWPGPDLSFHTAFLAMTNMVFAYAGHIAFFSFIAELKDPKEFPKALAFLQISDTSLYIVTSVVIYYYAGDGVTSPALNSASPLFRKIAFGIALPTIVIAGVINGHVAVKYLYVRLLRNSKADIMHQKTPKAIGIWVAICAALWTFAWIIAEAIPVFSDLLGVTSALFASWFTFGLSGLFWFHNNFERRDDKKWWRCGFRAKSAWNWRNSLALVASCLNIVAGVTICIVGIYASGKSIAVNAHDKRPFSCAG